jgi:hypothetical protein
MTMTHFLLDHSDGSYSVRQLTIEEARDLEERGFDVASIEDGVLAQWHRHCDEEYAWQALWRTIDNALYASRKMRELLPMDQAEWKIRQLTEERDQARRMWQFYEDQYNQRLTEKHRDEYDTYTCVYPQPGCDVEALPLPWRERAAEILETYNPERTEGGLKYQGCCCGHEHLLLDDATAQKLRDAGFLVENDTETF